MLKYIIVGACLAAGLLYGVGIIPHVASVPAGLGYLVVLICVGVLSVMLPPGRKGRHGH